MAQQQTPLDRDQEERLRALNAREHRLAAERQVYEENRQKFAVFRTLKPEMDAIVEELEKETAELDRKEADLKAKQPPQSRSFMRSQGLAEQPLSHDNYHKLRALVDDYEWRRANRLEETDGEDADGCFLSLTADGKLLGEFYCVKSLLK